MNYLHVPEEISLKEIRAKSDSLSPGMYRRVIIPTPSVKRMKDLLNPSQQFDKGVEPGSMWYMKRSAYYFIRTKALQNYSSLIYPKGDSIIPINHKVFVDPELHEGDILMAKDSNVGESAVIDGDQWKNYMFSGGVVRLHPDCDRYYLFSFLKHPLFKTQLTAMTARGATITHAKTLWLDCLIPFPNQEDADRVVSYVSALMEAIVDKERESKRRHHHIISSIDIELTTGYTGSKFIYSYPLISEIRSSSRMDTGLYCAGFREFKHRIDNYKFGSTCLSDMGIKSRRGPNLAVSVTGKSIYSGDFKQAWYQLIRPVNIGEYGTLIKREWLGTNKKLPTVDVGGLILGCEGFEKGRSIVLVELMERCTTNFHGTVLSLPGRELWRIIFVRCFFAYLREHGVIDWVGVGGSGGHMSPNYFDYLPFPRFPDTKQEEIARLYHNPSLPPKDTPTLDTFVDWHRRWNVDLGIWELDREMKELQRTLANVQEQIIEGKTVKVPI